MKVSNIKEERRSGKNYSCPHFTVGYVECHFPRDCSRCELADRMRREVVVNNNTELLFTEKDVLRQTDKGGGSDWWHFPIVLKESVMERLGVEKNLFYQIAIADGGPGVFLKNPMGFIDIHLFVDHTRKFTISRSDAFGIPNDRAIERFDRLFFMDLCKVVDKARGTKGVWCL